jgi:hypothetical protein
MKIPTSTCSCSSTTHPGRQAAGVRGARGGGSRAWPGASHPVVRDPRPHPRMARGPARNQVVLHRRDRPRQGRGRRVAVSPRSIEFLEAPERRLGLARAAIGQDPAGALSAAYYAMLYAARAALSERDVYAKTLGRARPGVADAPGDQLRRTRCLSRKPPPPPSTSTSNPPATSAIHPLPPADPPATGGSTAGVGSAAGEEETTVWGLGWV